MFLNCKNSRKRLVAGSRKGKSRRELSQLLGGNLLSVAGSAVAVAVSGQSLDEKASPLTPQNRCKDIHAGVGACQALNPVPTDSVDLGEVDEDDLDLDVYNDEVDDKEILGDRQSRRETFKNTIEGFSESLERWVLENIGTETGDGESLQEKIKKYVVDIRTFQSRSEPNLSFCILELPLKETVLTNSFCMQFDMDKLTPEEYGLLMIIQFAYPSMCISPDLSGSSLMISIWGDLQSQACTECTPIQDQLLKDIGEEMWRKVMSRIGNAFNNMFQIPQNMVSPNKRKRESEATVTAMKTFDRNRVGKVWGSLLKKLQYIEVHVSRSKSTVDMAKYEEAAKGVLKHWGIQLDKKESTAKKALQMKRKPLSEWRKTPIRYECTEDYRSDITDDKNSKRTCHVEVPISRIDDGDDALTVAIDRTIRGFVLGLMSMLAYEGSLGNFISMSVYPHVNTRAMDELVLQTQWDRTSDQIDQDLKDLGEELLRMPLKDKLDLCEFSWKSRQMNNMDLRHCLMQAQQNFVNGVKNSRDTILDLGLPKLQKMIDEITKKAEQEKSEAKLETLLMTYLEPFVREVFMQGRHNSRVIHRVLYDEPKLQPEEDE